MRKLWLVCVLMTASAVVWAQPGPAPSAQTDRAQSGVASIEAKVRQLAAQRTQVAQRYQDELSAIDRLKGQKGWRQQRELRDRLADSKDTADQLQRVTGELATAQRALDAARGALVKAIDGELAVGGVSPARAQQLAKLRASAAPAQAVAKKIVIPDAEVDPAAAPEELEQQAAAIREAEAQLARQKIGLEKQFDDIEHADALRREHQRANDLAMRDDDQPRRTAQQSASKGIEDQTTGFGGGDGHGGGENPAPQQGGGAGGAGDGLPPDRSPTPAFVTSGAFESQISVTLGDVFDHSTAASLIKDSRSSDPAQRAEAAKRARDAVAAKLEMLQKKRKLIEERAKALRKH